MTPQEYYQLRNGSQSPSQAGGGDTIPQLVGALTGSLGQIGAGALDVGTLGVAAPFVNPMTGGAALGGLGQGATQAVQNLLQKKPLMQNVGSEAGQGAIYGAIPGGDEMSLGKMGVRAATGLLGGTGAQAVSNAQQGKNPIQANDLTSGGIAGTLNALLPGVGKLGSAITDTSGNVLNKIAKHFVGDEASRNPVVRGALALTDKTGGKIPLWQQSRDSLLSSAQGKMQELNNILEGKTAKLSDFIKSAQKDMGSYFDPTGQMKTSDLQEMAENYIRQNVSSIDPSLKSAITGGGDLDVPLNILNEVKRGFGQPLQKVSSATKTAKATYSNIRQFIEDEAEKANVGDGTIVHGLNKDYNDLKEASELIDKKFGGATTDMPMEHGLGWMSRMGLSAGIGSALATLGMSAGSPYSGGATAIPFALFALKEFMMRNPEAASKYAGMLSHTPVLGRALQQLGVRAPGMANQ